MKIGALFAGYGGLEHGVQAAIGGDVVWYSEIDKGALKILTHRYPTVPNIGDITTVDWAHVEPVDILTGGSPCQDLSHAGKRAGMTEGTRSNLWVAMREAIAQLRPGLVVWENVRGAYSADADSALEHCPGCMGDGRPGTVLRALGRVLGDLADLGYDAGWHGVRASDVGAPHQRFRVFVVAYPSSDAGRISNGDSAAVTDSDGAGRCIVGRQRGLQLDVDGRSGADGPRAATEPAPLLPTPATSDTNGAGHHGDGGLDLRTAVSLLPTPRSRPPHSAARVQGNQATTWGDYADAINRWEHALGRTAPAPTQTGSKGNPQLSPAFVEWMMGLPAGWVIDTPGLTRNEALKALGNGVVPQQAEAALRLLLPILEVAA